MLNRIIVIPLVLFSIHLSYSQTLDYYLERGLQNSPLLKDYQNQIHSATLDSLMVVATRRPQINANATVYYAPTFNNGMNGYDEVISNIGDYSAIIGVQQNIFNNKTISNKYSAIQLQKQSLENTRKISANELKRVITNQYITVYSEYSDLSFNQAFLKLMLDEKEIMKTLVDHGVYKQTDYLSLLIETQSQGILVHQLMTQLTKEVRYINQLCGINEPCQDKFDIPSLSKRDQVNYILSPLFIQYRLDSLKILNEKSLVDVRYLPKISWAADAGFLSSTPSSFYQHYGFSVGLNLSIPIYDGQQRKLDYQKLVISENTRANYESYFKNQYNVQVLQLNNDLTNNKVLIDQLKSQRSSSEELINLAKAQLNYGNIPITEFINAAKNYILVNRNLTQAQLKELVIINELNYLMQ